MVWPHPFTFWRKTKCDGDLELLERPHLSIEPCLRTGSKAVGPTQAGSNVSNSKRLQPPDGGVQPMIFEMKPLTDSENRSDI